MTSRRSMLKGIAALWLGGWRGLGRKAGAEAALASAPTTGSGTGLQYEYGYGPNDGSCVVYTYDADGRPLSETRTGGEVCYYSYGSVA